MKETFVISQIILYLKLNDETVSWTVTLNGIEGEEKAQKIAAHSERRFPHTNKVAEGTN